MHLSPEDKAIGQENYYSALSVSRRDFLKGAIAAGAVSGAGLGAMYFGYEKVTDPVRVAVIGTGDEGQVLIGACNPDYVDIVAICDIRPYNVHRAFHGDWSSDAAIAARPGLISKGKFADEKAAKEQIKVYENYKDAIALTALPKLLPIPTSALTTSDADLNGVTDSIPAGMRAVTVRVDAQSAVEGWAQSGSHVDVILLKPDPGQKSGVRSRIIAQDIKVLSVNSIAEPNRSDQVASKAPSTVTLLTSQQDALKITTAANLGRLMFALRGADDRKPLEITELGSAEFDDAEIVKGPEEDYQGMAQANGKTFVLGRGKRWMETTEKQKGADSARAALSTESPDDMVLDAAPVAAAPSKMPYELYGTTPSSTHARRNL